jgi:hypothetical protein
VLTSYAELGKASWRRRRRTSDEHHDYPTDNAAMSTLMRTLRNLRKIGFKVRALPSSSAVRSAN